MNDFHDDEQIRKFMKLHPPAQPPVSLMKNYEQEVLKKIHHAGNTGPDIPLAWGLSAAAALLLAGGLAFYFLGLRAPTMSASVPRETGFIRKSVDTFPLVKASAAPAAQEQETVPDEASEETMSRDLLILEMLGEDDGILEGFEPLAFEISGWLSSPAASTTL